MARAAEIGHNSPIANVLTAGVTMTRSPDHQSQIDMPTFEIEVVLRETDRAVTERASHPVPPSDWTEDDVRDVLKTVLRAIDRVKNPGAPPRDVTLRGFSWIVEPSGGHVVIAIEIPTGAAVAGPFDIPRARLAEMIGRVVATGTTVSH